MMWLRRFCGVDRRDFWRGVGSSLSIVRRGRGGGRRGGGRVERLEVDGGAESRLG